MGNVFLNFHSRVLCMNGLWGGWGPAAGRAGMDAGSQPLRGKDSQGGGGETNAVIVIGLLVPSRRKRWLSEEIWGWYLTWT